MIKVVSHIVDVASMSQEDAGYAGYEEIVVSIHSWKTCSEFTGSTLTYMSCRKEREFPSSFMKDVGLLVDVGGTSVSLNIVESLT